jgi:hypothetical protein
VSILFESQTPSSYRSVLANLVAPNLQYIRLHLGRASIVQMNSDWAEIDYLLGSGAFCSLRGVKVIVRPDHLSSCEMKWLVEEFVQKFPWLALMGVLDVEVTIPSQ